MKRICFSRWTWLLVANVVVVGMLGFYSTLGAAPQLGQPPFANQVEQLDEQIRELREIKELLKEQNALLRSGKAKQTNVAPQATKPSLH